MHTGEWPPDGRKDRIYLEVVRGEEGLDVVAGVEVLALLLLLLRDHALGGPPLPGRGGAVASPRLPVGTVRRPAPGRRRRVDGLLLLAAVRLAAAPLLERETHAGRMTNDGSIAVGVCLVDLFLTAGRC